MCKRLAAIETLAERLHWKLEHVDSTGAPAWPDLTDHQRDIFRTAVASLLDEPQLVYMALACPDDSPVTT